jgi:hypothetical protein
MRIEMDKWIEHYNREWEHFESHWEVNSEQEGSKKVQQRKAQFDFLMELWKFLTSVSEKEKYLTVLPGFKIDEIKCDAVMISAGGIYLYHLLPHDATQLNLVWPRLIAYHAGEAWEEQLETSRKSMSAFIRHLGHNHKPVYQIYIAPPSFNGRYALEDNLILNLDQLSHYFQNLVFRQTEDLNEIISIIQQHRFVDPKYLPTLLGPADQQEEPIPVEVEVQMALDEVREADKQAASIIETDLMEFPTQVPPQPSQQELPPRRRETKKKQTNWWTKLFR